MTSLDFRRIEKLLQICDTNVARCQEVVTRSSALVKRAKKLIDVCQKTLKDREAAALKSIGSTQRAVAASERLLVGSTEECGRKKAQLERTNKYAIKIDSTNILDTIPAVPPEQFYDRSAESVI